MQIIKDDPAYLGLQDELVRALAGDVRDTLREAAESGASFEDAVKALTVKVAAIFDGSRPMTRDGLPVVPMLMFGVVGDADTVIQADDTQPMHERALSAAEELLGG